MNRPPIIRIVHISDFHIGDKTNDNEFLSENKYIDFVNSFVTQVKRALNEEPVDFLFLTGDFVDKGNMANKLQENMDHAKVVVEHLKSKLSPAHISTCIGNHDLDMNLISSDFEGSKSVYSLFANDFSLKESKVLPGSTTFIKVEKMDDIYIATIDINYRSNSSRKNRLELSSDDYVIAQKLLKSVPVDKPLIICSHLPWVVFRGPELIAEENGWMDKHLWISGLSLYDKDLFERRNEAWTLYLYGDAHHPKFLQEGRHFHVLTSTFGGGDFTSRRFENSDYNKIIEGTIIEVDQNKLNYTTVFLKTEGQTYSTAFGSNWTIEEAKSYSLNSTARSLLFFSPAGEQTYFKDYKTEKISEKVSLRIKENVKENELYRFGRFPISKTHASLGWISIHKLFEANEMSQSENSDKLLHHCICAAHEWLVDVSNPVIESDELNSENSLLLGINLWGGVFASFVGMMSNIASHLVVVDSGGGGFLSNRDCSPFERLEHYIDAIEKMTALKNIVIFTDVVSTGETVLNMKRILTERLNTTLKISVISIISDCDIIRKGNFEDFHRVGTLCKDMKLPIIHIDTLPDESILASRYSLHG